MNKSLLIIFIKNPILGKVKTRLAATIGPERALNIYLQLLQRTLEITMDLPVDKVVYYSDFLPAGDDMWDKNCFQKMLQSGENLGVRMQYAFDAAFAEGYSKVCIIGSDCYQLTTEILANAFAQLNQQEVVIGPSTDGGYYLLGMNVYAPELFLNKNWSTDSVLPDTLTDIQNLNKSYFLLPQLTDVDEEVNLNTMPATKAS